MSNEHTYAGRLIWEGNNGSGTSRYDGYSRQYRLLFTGKPDLIGSADPIFRGDHSLYNPEELLLGAIAGCHMLSYLALCAREGIRIESYTDSPVGRMLLTSDGGGRFTDVKLSPVVTVDEPADAERALALHDRARDLCFIANSCNFPILHEPRVQRSRARNRAK